MKTCDKNHQMIVYDGKTFKSDCPVCALKDEIDRWERAGAETGTNPKTRPKNAVDMIHEEAQALDISEITFSRVDQVIKMIEERAGI